MERIEANKEMTRLRNDDQYLQEIKPDIRMDNGKKEKTGQIIYLLGHFKYT